MEGWQYGPTHSSALCHGCFIPGEGAPITCWLGGWVGLRTGPDAVAKRKEILSFSLLGF